MLYLLYKLAMTFLRVGWQPTWKVWPLPLDLAAHAGKISNALSGQWKSFRSCNNSIETSSPERNAEDLAGNLAAGKVSDTSPKYQHQDLPPHLHLQQWGHPCHQHCHGKRIIIIDHNKVFIINTIHIDDGRIVLRLSSYCFTMCTKESVIQRESQICTGVMIRSFQRITACVNAAWHVTRTMCQMTKVGTKPLETFSTNSTILRKWCWRNTWLKIHNKGRVLKYKHNCFIKQM